MRKKEKRYRVTLRDWAGNPWPKTHDTVFSPLRDETVTVVVREALVKEVTGDGFKEYYVSKCVITIEPIERG